MNGDRPLPRAKGSVVWTTVRDGAVLFCSETELYFGLNSVGAIIWELLPQGATLDDLCAAVAARFPDVDRAMIAGDVADLLDELTRLELLEPRHAA
jgi:coenzyme PQQ synthesis protein D (PqqD)